MHMNLQKKTRLTVKNFIPLGYILYEATTDSWVTFSYELTGLRKYFRSFVMQELLDNMFSHHEGHEVHEGFG
jgi:hypothetical protein